MDELTPITQAALSRLSGQARTPAYDRQGLTPGIIHIGLGNFHRAHQAWYLHRLMDEGVAQDWAIIGASVRSNDIAQRARLLDQDCLTTLVKLDPSDVSAEVVGSMIDYLPIEGSNQSLILRMAMPDIRIVSLTVTEGGYYFDQVTGGFDASHPDMLHDAANPDTPKTAFGAMIAALKLRRSNGHGPFTGQSCDNLQGNGAILRQTVVSLARLSDPDMAQWIDTHCTFPDSMVDCIVPATGPEELALVRKLGIDDQAPVTHEAFRHWVIEDEFCAGRPPWERVGATVTADVRPYETMKIRILNGGHQIIGMAGELLSIGTIAGTMKHPLIRSFFRKVVTDEIAPHVNAVPGMSALQYLELIDTRFSNPQIKDTTRRVAFDGSSRQPGFLFPSIRDGLDTATPVSGLALATAMWCKYCEGVRGDGSAIEPNDPKWPALQSTAIAAKHSPGKWLEMRQYYGELADDSQFRQSFVFWHRILSDQGVEAAIEAFLSGAQASVA